MLTKSTSRLFQLNRHFSSRSAAARGNRVLITGLGMVSPLGTSVNQSWQNLLAGQCGIKSLKHLKEFDSINCKIGAPLHDDYSNIEDQYITSFGKDARIYTLANCIVAQAIDDSPTMKAYLEANREDGNYRVGCVLANQYGVQQMKHDHTSEKGLGKLRLIKEMYHLVPSMVAVQHKLRGVVAAPSLSSGSGMAALGHAYQLIKGGFQDAVIVGGLDFNVNLNAIGGMEAFKAVTTKQEFVDNPEQSCRPFSESRAGTVLGDGGSVMILQSEEFWLQHKDRDPAEVYCEFGGFGQTCDANHILAPTEKGTGLITAINLALREAGIDIEAGGDANCVDLVNCHATSTPKGDASEAQCIQEVLSRAPENHQGQKNTQKAIISANKGNVAHMVAGAAITESVFAIKSLQTGQVPAIHNLTNDGSGGLVHNGLNYATEASSGHKIDTIVKNSLTFGGNNMCAVFKRYGSQN